MTLGEGGEAFDDLHEGVSGIVIWAVRRKPEQPPVGPREGDTAWNDPITPGQTPTPRETFTHEDPHAAASQEPRP